MIPKAVQAVVLDLNGVVTTDLNQTMPALAQALGISLEPARLHALWYPLYLQASLGRISPDQLWGELREKLAPGSTPTGHEETQWLAAIYLKEPGLARTLAGLQARYRLGLLSNYVGRWARAILDREGLSSYLSAVLISSDVGVRKPDPEVYQRICRLVGVPSRAAIYVADEEEDLLTAQAVGMFPVFIPGEDATSRVGLRVASVSDLLDPV